MKTKKMITLLLMTFLLCNLLSCDKGPYEDCRVGFKIEFIDKNSKECFTEQDSLLSRYQLTELYLYRDPFNGYKEVAGGLSSSELGTCLFIYGGSHDFDKFKTSKLLFAVGEWPVLKDTIELNIEGNQAIIKVNGKLYEERLQCYEEWFVLRVEK